MDLRHAFSLALLWLCSLAVGCSRYPDGKILCEDVAECPGDEFRYCRADADSGKRKVCHRAAGAVADGGHNPVRARDSNEGGVEPSTSAGTGGGKAPIDAGPDTRPNTSGQAGRSTAPAMGDDGGSDGGPVKGFHVESSEPSEGATLEDMTAPLIVRFSAPIDAGSVTDVTFIVLENGNQIAGERVVTDQQVSFRPEQRWTLASRYEVVLSSSLFSKQQDPLPITHIFFRSRTGRWSAERLVTRENESELLAAPKVTSSATGEVAVGWDTPYSASRHTGSRVMRRTPDGWKELERQTAGAGVPLAILESGMLVYGVQPDDPGQKATVLCADPMLAMFSAPLTGVMDGHTSVIRGLGVDYNDVHVLLQIDGLYSQVRTSCSEGASATLYPLPLAAGASVAWDAIAFEREGVAAWSQTDPAADGGSNVRSVWALVRWAGTCAVPDGCPEQLSRAGVDADRVAMDHASLSTVVVVWRETEVSGSSIWAGYRGSSDKWRPARRVSAENVRALSPVVALHGDDALVVWVEQNGLERRVIAASYDAAADRWSEPAPLSESFVVPDSTGEDAVSPVLAAAPGGILVVWPQPTSQAGAHDLHATMYRSGEDWPGTHSDVFSKNHAAGMEVSVAADGFGRGYAAWIESDAIWFGRYE